LVVTGVGLGAGAVDGAAGSVVEVDPPVGAGSVVEVEPPVGGGDVAVPPVA
jgi:hypothetical protein